MGALLKSLLETEVFEPVKDTFDASAIHDKLDKAAEAEEIETIIFGLETDDDKIIKVFVNVKDADGFEEALSKKLGEEDNIEDLIDDLSKEFDIVDVEWPDDEDEDEDEEGDDDNDEVSPDGSDSLNPNIDYDTDNDHSDEMRRNGQYFSSDANESVSLGKRFLAKVVAEDTESGEVEVGDFVMIAKSQGGGAGDVVEVTDGKAVVEIGGTRKTFNVADLEVADAMAVNEAEPATGMDPEAADLVGRLGTTAYKRLALASLIALGIPAHLLDMMHKRSPMLFRDMGEKMRELGGANRMRIAQALSINAVSGKIEEDSAGFVDLDVVNVVDVADDAEPTDAKSRVTYGEEADWKVERSDDTLKLISSKLTVEFDDETTMDIIDGLGASKVIRVKDIDGNGPYIFSPRGNDYLLKTPENKEGFRLSDTIVNKILD